MLRGDSIGANYFIFIFWNLILLQINNEREAEFFRFLCFHNNINTSDKFALITNFLSHCDTPTSLEPLDHSLFLDPSKSTVDKLFELAFKNLYDPILSIEWFIVREGILLDLKYIKSQEWVHADVSSRAKESSTTILCFLNFLSFYFFNNFHRL